MTFHQPQIKYVVKPNILHRRDAMNIIKIAAAVSTRDIPDMEAERKNRGRNGNNRNRE